MTNTATVGPCQPDSNGDCPFRYGTLCMADSAPGGRINGLSRQLDTQETNLRELYESMTGIMRDAARESTVDDRLGEMRDARDATLARIANLWTALKHVLVTEASDTRPDQSVQPPCTNRPARTSEHGIHEASRPRTDHER